MQAAFLENSQSTFSGRKNKVSYYSNQGYTDTNASFGKTASNISPDSCCDHVATAFYRLGDPSNITAAKILTVF